MYVLGLRMPQAALMFKAARTDMTTGHVVGTAVIHDWLLQGAYHRAFERFWKLYANVTSDWAKC